MKKLFGKSLILIFAVLLSGIFFGITADSPAHADDASATISGKVTAITYGAWTPFSPRRRAVISIEDKKGKTHTVHLGRNTVYIPHRTPAAGDKVSAVCIKRKGVWAGLTITYK